VRKDDVTCNRVLTYKTESMTMSCNADGLNAHLRGPCWPLIQVLNEILLLECKGLVAKLFTAQILDVYSLQYPRESATSPRVFFT